MMNAKIIIQNDNIHHISKDYVLEYINNARNRDTNTSSIILFKSL